MTRWQYRTVDAGAFDTVERMVEALGELGADGWELVVGVDKASNWIRVERAILVFRRPVFDGDEPVGPWAARWDPTTARDGHADDYAAMPY